ncbi:MAG: ATP-dependent DNA helicase RecG, partial [Polaromonas sp. 39-63-203]
VALATLEDRSHPAWQRLKAEELLAQQLSQLQARRVRAAMRAPPLSGPGVPGGSGDGASLAGPHCSLHDQLLERLPFRLTPAQQRVCAEIEADLQKNVPMHRLLQGDVGSGKTVVAALAAARCIDAGWQCALMAPTEILAEQHFRKLISWLEPLGITTAWLTGSQKAKERREALAMIESGAAGLVIGTHAVIQDKVVFKNLALAIIDEQHRFGVAQRLALRSKTSPAAVETSENPGRGGTGFAGPQRVAPSRGEAATRSESARGQLAEGRQIYWVCPLIEESESIDLVNATQTHEALSAALPGVGVGLLHSRMPPAEKKAVMSLFVDGVMGVLVSTTVIEVGVDVPNASLMVIEHSERFGLSQLHQLRGRVGRGAAASACVLLYSTGDAARLGEVARARLKAMVETQDGFEISRRDLEIRGPGEFLGARQSGAPLLRFADLTTDADLLAWARGVAPVMLDQFAELAERHVLRWLGGKGEYLKA